MTQNSKATESAKQPLIKPNRYCVVLFKLPNVANVTYYLLIRRFLRKDIQHSATICGMIKRKGFYLVGIYTKDIAITKAIAMANYLGRKYRKIVKVLEFDNDGDIITELNLRKHFNTE